VCVVDIPQVATMGLFGNFTRFRLILRKRKYNENFYVPRGERRVVKNEKIAKKIKSVKKKK